MVLRKVENLKARDTVIIDGKHFYVEIMTTIGTAIDGGSKIQMEITRRIDPSELITIDMISTDYIEVSVLPGA